MDRTEPRAYETEQLQRGKRAASPSCLSLKSNHSKAVILTFNDEPGATAAEKRRRSHGVLEQQLPWDQSVPSGASSCCPCGSGLQSSQRVDVLQDVLDQHKISLKSRCERVIEGTHEGNQKTLLNSIYTELCITEGFTEEVNTQHEVRQLETVTKTKDRDTPISGSCIFKDSSGQQGHIRVVLTSGVAGVGKTFSVLKFTLDWAQGLENQDLDLVILLSFRELNLVKEKHCSLLELLQVFHPTLQKLTAEKLALCKVLFILDGLGESRLQLNFRNNSTVTDVTQRTSVSVLLANLIKGNLIPSALVWITSRPAAATQIPSQCVNRVTEVQGFTGAQKEEYFKRRFKNEEVSNKIISHVKASRNLHSMCQIPVFCWITALVLEHMLTTEQTGELPKTLTDILSDSELSATPCEIVASALKCDTSHLTLLDLSRNKNLRDSGVKMLCAGLESPNCRLQVLRLINCSLSELSCGSLASALQFNPLHLRELDLSDTKLQDFGVKLLSDYLQMPNCKLETLRLRTCSLSELSCGSLASALQCNPSHLRQLDLSDNKLQGSGEKLLRAFVGCPRFNLETLSC